MSVIKVINRTSFVILKLEDSCYKGERQVDFNRVEPAVKLDGLYNTTRVSVYASTSGLTDDSASAIVLNSLTARKSSTGLS
jgi:hypothetical protein